MLMKLPSTSEAIDEHVQSLSALQSYVLTYQKWLRIIGTWIGRSRQRRALANLDDRFLNDVGITRSAAAREIAKPFWRWTRSPHRSSVG